MSLKPPQQRLMAILGLGWLAFAGLGLGLRYRTQPLTITVIIVQSYCPSKEWQTSVIHPYQALYQKSQTNQQKIIQVVVVTDMGHITLSNIPAPDDLGQPFGNAPRPEILTTLKQRFSNNTLLQCRQT